MKKTIYGVAAAAGIAAVSLGIATQSFAHHSFASEFDVARPVEVEGRVTKVRFVNPHAWLFLDVRNANGTTTNWGFEFGSPSVLAAKDISRTDVPIGSTVHIAGFRSKNTGPFGYAQEVDLPGGRKVQVGSAPDAPTLRRGRGQ